VLSLFNISNGPWKNGTNDPLKSILFSLRPHSSDFNTSIQALRVSGIGGPTLRLARAISLTAARLPKSISASGCLHI